MNNTLKVRKYLNLDIENDTDLDIDAAIVKTRTDSIFTPIEEQNQYEVSVNRFRIPSSSIQLLKIDDDYSVIYKYTCSNRTITDKDNNIVYLIDKQQEWLDTTNKIYSQDGFLETINKALMKGYTDLCKIDTTTTESKLAGLALNAPQGSINLTFNNTFGTAAALNGKLVDISINFSKLKFYGGVSPEFKIKLYSPNNTHQILVYQGLFNDNVIYTDILFNETSDNVSNNVNITQNNMDFKFRESSLDILEDLVDTNGVWTLEISEVNPNTSNTKLIDLEATIHFQYAPKINNELMPNKAPYVSIDEATDSFILNYSQQFNRMNINLGFSRKLSSICEFDLSNGHHTEYNEKYRYVNYPKYIYDESEYNKLISYKQESNSVYKLLHASKLELRTITMPVQAELETESGVSSRLLTDFIVPSSIIRSTGYMEFNSKQKRKHHLSSSHFKQYDLEVWVKYINADPSKRYERLILKPQESVSVKLEIESINY